MDESDNTLSDTFAGRTAARVANEHGVEVTPAEVKSTMRHVLNKLREALREKHPEVEFSDAQLMDMLVEYRRGGGKF